jgi:hypothetical protein
MQLVVYIYGIYMLNDHICVLYMLFDCELWTGINS